MAAPPVVGLEIGTSKIIALIGEMREDGNVMITGMGEHARARVEGPFQANLLAVTISKLTRSPLEGLGAVRYRAPVSIREIGHALNQQQELSRLHNGTAGNRESDATHVEP